MEQAVLDYVRRHGPVKTYQIAKALRLTYGGAQYWVSKLEREGMLKTRKVLGAVVVYVDGQNPLDAVTARDLINYLSRNRKAEELLKKMLLCVDDGL